MTINQPFLAHFNHPNCLTPEQRENLPDPCRPIYHPVISVKYYPSFLSQHFFQTHQPKFEQDFWQINRPFDVHFFIQQQQERRQKQLFAPLLPLVLLTRFVSEAGIYLLEKILAMNTKDYPNTIENKLQMMTQIHHYMLCVFLLCQCKPRKTLNYQLTLRTISLSINRYIQNHRHELNFITQDPQLLVLPKHVQFAILILNWQVSQHHQIGERITNISSQNLLLRSDILV